MEFLRLLEGLRTPVLDGFMSAITYMGDVTLFIVFAMVMFWCVDKRGAYSLFAVGFLGTTLNQFLKLLFRIPRPWVADPSFTIVESARAAATGYSFPSGHTQNVVGTLGVIGLTVKQKWLKAICCVFIMAFIGMVFNPWSDRFTISFARLWKRIWLFIACICLWIATRSWGIMHR